MQRSSRLPACSPRLPPQSRRHRWHSQPIRHRRTAAVAGSKAGRACACAGRVQRQAGRQRPDRRGRLLRGRRGGLARCSRSRRSSGSGGRRPRSAVGGAAVRIGACVQSAVACTGKELDTYVGRGGCFAFLPGSWLCWGCAVQSSGSGCSGRFGCTCVVGGAIKAPDGGGYGECAANAAREQAHRHHCLNGCWRAAPCPIG